MNSTIRLLGILCFGALAAALTACASPGTSQCEATGVLCPPGTHCAAAEPICISDTNHCGDAHVDPDEVCDDGNTKDGDGCSADCKSNETCGNGRIDVTVGEVCDEPLKKDASGRFICSADCKSNETCGNGIVDKEVGEVCDDGNQIDGDGCSKDCKSDETCGNGIVDKEVGEVCDDGNTVDGDACSHCTAGSGCGNGIIDFDSTTHLPLEECDDGNTDNNDDCRTDCVINRCGDGVVDSDGAHKEACDAATEQNGGSRTVTPTESDTCNIDCTLAACGDGKVNHQFKPDGVHVEQCDNGSGNSDNADCTAGCQINVCGDGHQNTTVGHAEACDSGGIATSTCDFDCTKPECGDGIVNSAAGEQCDDGKDSMGNNNNHAGAHCNASCQLNVCGDGDTLAGIEQCDGGHDAMGNPQDTSLCDHDCTLPVCGDKIVNTQAGEACDDGPDNGTANSVSGCNAFCKFKSCGNGIREQGEACDDGNGAPQDSPTCDSDCTLASCGDDHLNLAAGEKCDEGVSNGKLPSKCSATCQPVSCGNGAVEQGEQCDDGKDAMGNNNNHAGARCNASCQLNVCGDADTLVGVEQCDGGNDGAGNPKDTDKCDHDCTFAVCGDGLVNTVAGEQCDDGDKNGTSASPNSCDSFCKTNLCGNGIVDVSAGEECDPGGGPNPSDSPTCTSTCHISRCGDGHTNAAANEVCDDGASNGDVCDYNKPDCTRCNSTCTGTFNPGGPFCGDGILQSQFGEQCEPKGGPDQDSKNCDSDCTAVVCGDGHTNTVAGEDCDDGNADACGTCTASCSGAVTPTQATGSISVVASLPGPGNIVDGDTFTLDDGFHPAVVFEFDVASDGTVGPGNTAIVLTGDGSEDAGAVATKIRAAIGKKHDVALLDITTDVAGSNGEIVLLTNTHLSSRGNTLFAPTGAIATSFIFSSVVTGSPPVAVPSMFGGLAGDCPAGTGCKTSADCAGTCDGTQHCTGP